MAAARKDDSKPATSPVPAGDEVAAEVQRATDRAQAQGFYGVETDPTPNEHYTVSGVTEGLPTPETDKGAAAEARRAAGLA
ncbi:hypothetical protein ACFVFF_23340 [Streptomyces sp. NPDC057680]|uniref:hypothetical protein n=1 Tax=Streptomyces sp. NPDC057680 TaxID=3346208 RepID=UPI003681B11D